MDETGTVPLIVTAQMAEPAQSRFDALRRAHFPPARNFLSAHVTLFHVLPAQEQRAVEAALRVQAAEHAALDVTVSGIRFLGRGVAYSLDSPALLALRGRLAQAFAPWLTAQDRRGFRPHVTVQNKVGACQARALEATLGASPLPPPFFIEGLALWRYRGGPWEAVGVFPFTGAR